MTRSRMNTCSRCGNKLAFVAMRYPRMTMVMGCNYDGLMVDTSTGQVLEQFTTVNIDEKGDLLRRVISWKMIIVNTIHNDLRQFTAAMARVTT